MKMEEKKNTQREILLIEDNPCDVELTKEAFEQVQTPSIFAVAGDGAKAISLLNERKQAKSKLPDVILLDINMPKKNGFEVLTEIKNDEVLKYIPVIMLTTSSSVDDISKCYSLQANSYLTKPDDMNGFYSLVKTFEDFWFDKVKLPA